MKSKILILDLLFFCFLLSIQVSYGIDIKVLGSVSDIPVSNDTDFIDVCIRYHNDLQLVSMVDADKMSRYFNIIDTEIKGKINDVQPDFLKSVEKFSANELWTYNVNIKDTITVNQLLKDLCSQHVFPNSIQFVWSYFPKDATKILLLAIEKYGHEFSILTGKNISNIYKKYDENRSPILFIEFNKNVSKFLQEYTSESIGKYYGFLRMNRIIAYRLIKYELPNSILVID